MDVRDKHMLRILNDVEEERNLMMIVICYVTKGMIVI